MIAKGGASLAALLLAGAATPAPPLVFPEADRILVEKGARTLTLYGVDGSVHRITGIQLGDAPVGPKQFEGDEKTPEGRFTIDYGNPSSAYHLSLHIDYPRAEHVAYAKSQGRSAGGVDHDPRPAQFAARRAAAGRLDRWLHRPFQRADRGIVGGRARRDTDRDPAVVFDQFLT